MKMVFWAGLALSMAVLLLSAGELDRVFENLPYYAEFQTNPMPAYAFLFAYSLLVPLISYALMRRDAIKVAVVLNFSSAALMALITINVPNGIIRY